MAITGSFVSTTVRGGTGNDTINVDGDTASGEASSYTAIFAGDGTDSLIAKGRGITVYGGSSADSTSDGADTLSITNLYDSTVYGAAGADSIVLANAVDSVRVEGGADADEFSGDGNLNLKPPSLVALLLTASLSQVLLPAVTSMVVPVTTHSCLQASKVLPLPRQLLLVVKV